MNWIPHPLVLQGTNIRMEPLQTEHIPDLIRIGRNKAIWEHFPIDGTDETTLTNNLKEAILKRAYGEQYPFVLTDKVCNRICGSTRLFELFPQHRKLEIGWTWYDPAYWGTGINAECKLLLLDFCFEILNVQRVQLKTRDSNLRSQAAIRKIGARYEGTLRKDRIMANGEARDTMVFSILDEEWSAVKAQITGLSRHQKNSPINHGI